VDVVLRAEQQEVGRGFDAVDEHEQVARLALDGHAAARPRLAGVGRGVAQVVERVVRESWPVVPGSEAFSREDAARACGDGLVVALDDGQYRRRFALRERVQQRVVGVVERFDEHVDDAVAAGPSPHSSSSIRSNVSTAAAPVWRASAASSATGPSRQPAVMAPSASSSAGASSFAPGRR